MTGTGFGANDPPDAAVNPVSGAVETVDAPADTANNSVIRHVTGTGTSRSVTTLAPPARNNAPRLAIAPGGDTWVVWWRQDRGGRVLYRVRAGTTGLWTAEQAVGDADEVGRFPSVAHGGGPRAWVAYAIPDPAGQPEGTFAIAIWGGDDPNPFPTRSLLAYTTFSQPAPEVAAEDGAVWVTWIDSLDRVGWSTYDGTTQAWSAPAYEPYGADGPDGARGRIRARLVGAP